MRFSISIPQLDYDRFDDAGVKDYLARAEELGFEGGWTMEQVVGGSPQIAPPEMLAYAASCTTRLRLGVAVLITTLHDPLQLAWAVTAVDRLSHGRVDVGVGHGGKRRPFPAFGVDESTFVSYFAEGIELMKGRGLDRIYGDMPGIEDVPVSGTPDDVVRGVREVIDAGAEMVLLNPVGTSVAEDREQMERLAAEVIPHLL